jgi:hypothetical protein
LISVGKSLIEPVSQNNIYSVPHSEKNERNREKQKILDKLEELEKIQKFNEEKLMKDLEEL